LLGTWTSSYDNQLGKKIFNREYGTFTLSLFSDGTYSMRHIRVHYGKYVSTTTGTWEALGTGIISLTEDTETKTRTIDLKQWDNHFVEVNDALHQQDIDIPRQTPLVVPPFAIQPLEK